MDKNSLALYNQNNEEVEMEENCIYEVWGPKKSRAFRVLWLLEEMEISYTHHDVDFSNKEHHSASFLQKNPFGKVPVLGFKGHYIFESGAIIEFLASQHKEKAMAPPVEDFKAYGEYLQWNYFSLTELEQPLWLRAKHKFAHPKEYRFKEIEKTAFYEFGKAVDVIEKALEGREFLLGSTFYACDILVGNILIWGRSQKLLDERYPNAWDYVSRLKKRRPFLKLV